MINTDEFINKITLKENESNELTYDIVNYIKYEYPSRADKVKKSLEHKVVKDYLNKEFTFPVVAKTSLDIGCATCRYPKFFSKLGFQSVGYDISEESIKICTKIAEKENLNITAYNKNILAEEADYSTYDVLTCMMGTFNHFPKDTHKLFLNWVYESLKKEGIFIFSSWNKDSDYLNYLHFYNLEHKKFLENNSYTFKTLSLLLKDARFTIKLISPIVYLPDICYDSWLVNKCEDKMATIDSFLSENIDGIHSQMYVIVVQKL